MPRLAVATRFLIPLLIAVTWVRAAPPGEIFVRGDANASGAIDIADGIFILSHLFTGGPEPPCLDAADVDDVGDVNVTDAILVLHFLFVGGREPPWPFPDCDIDPTEDGLFCSSFPPCFTPFEEIDSVRYAYETLSTVAGKGEVDGEGINAWRDKFEGEPATSAELSKPHITLADDDGNLYIADKEAHAIRKMSPDGRITTYAGTNEPGDDDEPGPATERRLNEPNGLWVLGDGTVYILDTGNDQVKKVSTGGEMTTLFEVPGLRTGRGLWVADDEQLAYVCSRTVLLRWTPEDGVTTFASGFSQLGNLAVSPDATDIVVTDRNDHRVYRIHRDGSREAIAGNGTTVGGGDGEAALDTGLDQVRGVWPLEFFGGYFLATQAGSQVWYLDGGGTIHLFLDGNADGAHSGDGEHYSDPGEKVSNIRSITMDRVGNLLITEHDAGYVRRIEFIGIAIP